MAWGFVLKSKDPENPWHEILSLRSISLKERKEVSARGKQVIKDKEINLRQI